MGPNGSVKINDLNPDEKVGIGILGLHFPEYRVLVRIFERKD